MPDPNCDIAWAAGLFEGEGCITITHNTPVLRLGNTDEEVVRRFASIIVEGKVYGPYDNVYADGRTRKPRWVWVASAEAAQRAFDLMSPWLSTRRLARAATVLGPPSPPRPSLFP